MSIELPANEGEALAAAWRLQRSGNFVAAFDVAQDGVSLWPTSLPLQHLAILALASCGSTSAALMAYRVSGLGDSSVEDFLALEARLLKDLAFQAAGAEAPALVAQAAQAYELDRRCEWCAGVAGGSVNRWTQCTVVGIIFSVRIRSGHSL